jgi:hypothetical protein
MPTKVDLTGARRTFKGTRPGICFRVGIGPRGVPFWYSIYTFTIPLVRGYGGL